MEFSDQLVALVCAYNESELLPGLLDSLEGQVDRVVVADGRYVMYPGEGGPSTDDTVEIAASRGCQVIPSPERGWETEHEKRTALLTACDLGDECLVIDCDERLVANRDLRNLYGDYRITVLGVAPTEGRQDAVRLFMYRPGMEYRWHFGLFTRSQRNVLAGQSFIPISQARIDHFHHLRSPEREAQDKEYEAVLVPFERELGAYGGR